MERSVRLSDRSLREISMACFEAYPYECSGFLFGKYLDKSGWQIEEVHGLQRVRKRQKGGIEEYTKSKQRLFEGFSENNLLWGFHSHPKNVSAMSAEDKNYLRSSNTEYPLEIIIAINKTSKRGKIERGKDLRDYVSCGKDLFVLDYRAHYLAENNRIYTAKVIRS